ncbi:MAG: DUF4159 domain-containing protein [Gammaproteobacteria bacterium]|nr:DUF4159 domain-containing protein [Gammaproteobacteria bacterium]MDE0247412.1 DUF4159 domain-containing protein [Gammaproteobacteria bacterium]
MNHLAAYAAIILLLSPWDPAAIAETGAPRPASESAPPTIARLQYGGGGDWYAGPSALANLMAAIRERTGLVLAEREAVVTPLDPALPDYPYLFMTGHGNVAFNEQERDALRSYLFSGGFLHADDNYGLDEAFRREMAALFPNRPLVEVPPDHPVFHAFYDFPDGLPKIHEHDGEAPEAWGIFYEGRLVVFYSHESDLGNGWEDPEVHDDPPELREAALRMGVNLFVYAMTRQTP